MVIQAELKMRRYRDYVRKNPRQKNYRLLFYLTIFIIASQRTAGIRVAILITCNEIMLSDYKLIFAVRKLATRERTSKKLFNQRKLITRV